MGEIEFNLDSLKPAKGGGQGFWQVRCLNTDCDIITFQMWTNDLSSPSQAICPFCAEAGEKIGDSEHTTKKEEV